MKEYRCEYCEISFSRLSDTLRHLKTDKHTARVYKNIEQMDVAKSIIEYLESKSVKGVDGIRIDSAGGTGKTFTVTSIMKYCDKVVYLGPTHKSTNVLEQNVPKLHRKYCTTFHSYFGWSQDVDENNKTIDHWEPVKIQEGTIFVLDEISMMSRSISSLFKHFIYDKHKFILMGDRQQLPPIESKLDPKLPENVEYLPNHNEQLSLMFSFPCVDLKLVTNVRAGHEELVSRIHTIRSLVCRNKYVYLDKNYKFTKDWFEDENNAMSDYIILCFKNITKDYYNKLIRTYIKPDAKEEFVKFDKVSLEETIFKYSEESNKKIMLQNGQRFTISNVLMNEIQLGVYKIKQYVLKTACGNTLHRVASKSQREFEMYYKEKEHTIKINNRIEPCGKDCKKKHVCLTDEKAKENRNIRKLAFRELRNQKSAINYKLAHCFSLTTHKAQGSSYDTVFIIADDFNNGFNNNKLKYTAVSRAKKDLFIV